MLQSFFILCSGADRYVLEQCSDSEKTKYIGIGATVFFTAIMAFIASSYALFTVFDDPYIAIGFGIVWGLLIFNLDRFIVSTLKKRDQFLQEFLQALPRIILALIIAIVISKPLEIKIFEKEINTVLLKEKNALALNNKKEITQYYEKDRTKNEAEIDSLKSEISQKEKEVNQLYEIYITEAEGTAGTKKLGKGPVFKEKIAKHNLAKIELDSLKSKNEIKIKEAEEKSKVLQKNLDLKVKETQPIIDSFDGLMARINALNSLPWLPSFFIMLLFLAIETAPIFVKLISPKSEYDFRVEAEQLAIINNKQQDSNHDALHKNTYQTINEKAHEEIKNDEDLIAFQKKEAVELLKHQFSEYNKKHR